MITSEPDVLRRTGRPPVRRVPAARTVPRARRGRVALCPDPVPRPVPPAAPGLVRRVTAAAGLVLASAAAVVGLGLLADTAASAPDRAPAPVVLQAPPLR